MPKAIDPGQTFEIVLESDQDKPENERPTFVCRHLTGRKWRQLAATREVLEACTRDTEAIDKLYELAAVPIIGWRHMNDPDTGESIPFERGGLMDVVSPLEIHELMVRVQEEAVPSSGEESSSESLSLSSTGNSANSADPESA